MTTELIHEWMNEDRFLRRLTKRQQAILCTRLLEKLSQPQKELEDAKRAVEEIELKLMRYRKSYQELLRQGHPLRFVNRICQMIWIVWLSLAVSFMIRKITSSIPRGECSAIESTQTESYKTLALPW
jgi:hypothetical protein